MPKFIIERGIPNPGKLDAEELKNITRTYCGVLNKMKPQIQWLQSYITGDKIYCVYIAPNKEMILEQLKLGGFPADVVSEVITSVDPITTEQHT